MKANPVAILTIGIGVLLLNLAYTGRGAAVWRAITGGGGGTESESPDGASLPPIVSDGDGGRKMLQDPVTVRRRSDNTEMVADASDLKGAEPGGKCHIQSTAVVGPDGQTYCVANDRLYPSGPAAGDAEHHGLWGLSGGTWGMVR